MDIEKIFKENASYVYNHALKLTCDPVSAEDLAQETFISAWKNANQLRNAEYIKPWLRRICINGFLMKLRKEGKGVEISYEELTALEGDGARLQLSSDAPSPEDEIIVDETVREIQNGCFLAMARKLTLNQRIAFSLSDMFGLSLKEVADILEISESAAKGLLFRARMSLDDFFSKRCSFISLKNPCRCQAWEDFSKDREGLKRRAMGKKLIEKLDYTESGYVYDETVRKRVRWLYNSMPDKKPGPEWYDSVIKIINGIQ
jgi:RNA polymerase sigma factor, sigma-70 family